MRGGAWLSSVSTETPASITLPLRGGLAPDEVERLEAQVKSLDSLNATLRQQLVAEQQSSHDLKRELRQARAAAAEMAQLVLDSGMADDLSHSARRQLETIAGGSL